MWHKKHRAQDPEAPPGKRLRDNIVDLYASGEVPGERAHALLNDAGDFARSLGSGDLQDLRGTRTPGTSKNQQRRDLRRRLLKGSRWPPVYIAEVRCWSVRDKQLQPKKVAFLLPHEVVGVLSEVSDVDVLFQHSALDGRNQAKYTDISQQLQAPFVCLSLWGDGVPFSWDRKRSADMWAMSFPGLEDMAYRDVRVVLTAVPSESVCKETQDDILTILAWSAGCLALGLWPSSRHDLEEWSGTDDV